MLDYTVQFNVKTPLMGWVEYNIDTCALASTGNWTYNSLPQHGTPSTGTEYGYLSNGDCPGVQFPFNEIYYTWDKDQNTATTDTFNATWSTPDGLFSDPETFNFTLQGAATVTINSASLVNNVVNVTTSSGNSSDMGRLDIIVHGASADYTVSANHGDPVGSGTYKVPLARTKMPTDTYASITASWNLQNAVTGDMTLPNTWTVFGVYRHSQYNVPLESECPGSSNPAWVFNRTTCQFTSTSLQAQFMQQTRINGTGSSTSWSLLKTANAYPKACKGKYPQGATRNNSFAFVPSVTGTCNVVLTPDKSVATNPDPHEGGDIYKCRDTILLVNTDQSNKGVKSALDECPACSSGFNGTLGHIDNYTSSQKCKAHDIVDLGNYWTANAHGEH